MWTMCYYVTYYMNKVSKCNVMCYECSYMMSMTIMNEMLNVTWRYAKYMKSMWLIYVKYMKMYGLDVMTSMGIMMIWWLHMIHETKKEGNWPATLVPDICMWYEIGQWNHVTCRFVLYGSPLGFHAILILMIWDGRLVEPCDIQVNPYGSPLGFHTTSTDYQLRDLRVFDV